ncbi:MAG: DUF3054 domain-containing protein [Chloroflexi bacterium]|nr:DUF3054 domain-containing protein [Chloroflexota bacterium]
MKSFKPSKQHWILLCGDIVVAAFITAWGFASHDRLGTAGFRMLTTFIPVLAAWLMVAPILGAYDPQRAADPRQLWRPFWAMVLAGPMASLIRAFWLGQAIAPIFVIILGGFSALGLLAWRIIYWFIFARGDQSDG